MQVVFLLPDIASFNEAEALKPRIESDLVNGKPLPA